MKISLIVAAAENDVIGRDGGIPWRLPADLARFKRLTMGHHLVMGRKTFDSIGRALPGRVSVVLSRRPAPGQTPSDVVWVPTLGEALGVPREAGDDEAFVIGGSAVYGLALPMADRIHLTRVHAEIAGDVLLPRWDDENWREVERTRHEPDERHEHAFSFIILERTTPRGAIESPHVDD